MHIFGLKRVKALAAARFGGLRFLRIGRHSANLANSNIIYLRHASAMSAAIAKNMTVMMNQPDELLQETISKSDTEFLESHNRYSFIIVLVLTSLFMVVTISATGLMLAFCRKKNTVFIEPSKEETDSQFELDDIENTVLKTCRVKKGEFYIHLSDEDEDEDEKFGKHEKQWMDKEKRIAKRSITCPQLHEILIQRKSTKPFHLIKDSTANGHEEFNDITPLIQSMKCGPCKVKDFPNNSRKIFHEHEGHGQMKDIGNANKQFHDEHVLAYCQRAQSHVRRQQIYFYRSQLPCYGIGLRKLQRSHTIHAIPQTSKRFNPISALGTQYYDNQMIPQTGKRTYPTHAVCSRLYDIHTRPQTGGCSYASNTVYTKHAQMQAASVLTRKQFHPNSTVDTKHHTSKKNPQKVNGSNQTFIVDTKYHNLNINPRTGKRSIANSKHHNINTKSQTWKQSYHSPSANIKNYCNNKLIRTGIESQAVLTEATKIYHNQTISQPEGQLYLALTVDNTCCNKQLIPTKSKGWHSLFFENTKPDDTKHKDVNKSQVTFNQTTAKTVAAMHEHQCPSELNVQIDQSLHNLQLHKKRNDNITYREPGTYFQGSSNNSTETNKNDKG